MRWTFSVLVCALAIGTSAGPGAAKMNGYLSSPLANQARWLAQHGGVTGTCAGCATLRMQSLSKALVVTRFQSRGGEAVAWALCVVSHESGFNPGAVNSTAIAPGGALGHASGLAQFVVWYHRWINYWRLLRDPAYAADAMFHLSNGGRDRSPWAGGGYSCP